MNPVWNETVLLAGFCQNDIFFGYPASLYVCHFFWLCVSVILIFQWGTSAWGGWGGHITYEYINNLKLLGLTFVFTLTSAFQVPENKLIATHLSFWYLIHLFKFFNSLCQYHGFMKLGTKNCHFYHGFMKLGTKNCPVSLVSVAKTATCSKRVCTFCKKKNVMYYGVFTNLQKNFFSSFKKCETNSFFFFQFGDFSKKVRKKNTNFIFKLQNFSILCIKKNVFLQIYTSTSTFPKLA